LQAVQLSVIRRDDLYSNRSPGQRRRGLRPIAFKRCARPSTTPLPPLQFIVAAKQANMYINPMGGEKLQAIVSKIAGPPERMLTPLRQATQVQRPPGGGGPGVTRAATTKLSTRRVPVGDQRRESFDVKSV
jgi:hypothetical protein